jgi:hypothetical protein
MKRFYASILLIAALPSVDAATLYRWTDASGVARYGFQPPAGVEAEPADEERRELYEAPNAPPVQCQDLARAHLVLLDKEIARVQAMKAGLGPEFELTPSARQDLVLALLAQRAALVSGRPASEFRTPSSDEMLRAEDRLRGENMVLRNQVQTQSATIDAQGRRIQQQKGQIEWDRFMFRPWGPGYYPWPIAPIPLRR